MSATDANEDDVLTYSLSGLDANAFDIDETTGQLRTKAVLDASVKDTYRVTVGVHDGFCSDYGAALSIDNTIDVSIEVIGSRITVRTPSIEGRGSGGGGGRGRAGVGGAVTPVTLPLVYPTFGEGLRTTRYVPEDAQPGDNVGEPVVAKHTMDESMTYRLWGSDASLFAVGAQTGQIRVGEGTSFNYEGARNTYEVDLTASNSTGGVTNIKVDIIVTDVEMPGPADDYDRNRDERVGLDEAIAAVADYAAGTITRGQAMAVIALYCANLQQPERGSKATSDHSATRDIELARVAPDGQVQVTISATGYGAFAQVVETLPEGFRIVASNLPDPAVDTETNTVTFMLLGEEQFTYTVAAPSAERFYEFSGLIRNQAKVGVEVGGEYGLWVKAARTPTPTPTPRPIAQRVPPPTAAPTATPTPTPTSTPVPAFTPTPTATPVLEAEPPDHGEDNQNPFLWLLLLLLLAAAVTGGYIYARRRRRQ